MFGEVGVLVFLHIGQRPVGGEGVFVADGIDQDQRVDAFGGETCCQDLGYSSADALSN